jgi:toxin ParE1/3/4
VTPKKIQIVWTEIATGDLERLAAYLSEEAPIRAAAVIDRIVDRVESLSQSPGRGRIPPELRTTGEQTWRELQESPWRILYRVVDESRIEIHAVLDRRRDLQDVLMERLLRR